MAVMDFGTTPCELRWDDEDFHARWRARLSRDGGGEKRKEKKRGGGGRERESNREKRTYGKRRRPASVPTIADKRGEERREERMDGRMRKMMLVSSSPVIGFLSLHSGLTKVCIHDCMHAEVHRSKRAARRAPGCILSPGPRKN